MYKKLLAVRDIITENHGNTAWFVLDGLGTDPQKEEEIIDEVWKRLSIEVKEALIYTVKGLHTEETLFSTLDMTKSALSNTLISTLQFKNTSIPVKDFNILKQAYIEVRKLSEWQHIARIMEQVADEHLYAPWAVQMPTIWKMWDEAPGQFLVDPAGVSAGMPEMKIKAQGDSNKGHEGMLNLVVAQQLATKIYNAIEDGSFFENAELNNALLDTVARPNGKIVIKTLLSGEFGDDGFIHSAFKHLEGVAELVFGRLGISPDKVLFEFLLDGRDSPVRSSLETDVVDGVERYGFLSKAVKLLEKYDAVDSLGWIIGRESNDRDFKGGNIKQEYEMLTDNVGYAVANVREAESFIREQHAKGINDDKVPAIVIGEHGVVDKNTLFFNCIFRADRQQPITALLFGDLDFIHNKIDAMDAKPEIKEERHAGWDAITVKDLSGLQHWSIASYNTVLEKNNGGRTIFPDQPQAHNSLVLLNELAQKNGFPFRFATFAEGTKANHVQNFLRGTRSKPILPAERPSVIEASHGKESGVSGDGDFYKTPQMKHSQVIANMVKAMREHRMDTHLFLCNLSGPDMIGHLIKDHYEQVKETLRNVDQVLAQGIAAAEELGLNIVVFADHGNAENNSPDHGANPIVFSVKPNSRLLLEKAPDVSLTDINKLTDAAWVLMELFGLSDMMQENLQNGVLPPIPQDVVDKGFVGRSMVRVAERIG